MNLKSLRMLLTAAVLAISGQTWASMSLPEHTNPLWQDIASIVWSTDGGTSWGNGELSVGQTVEFKYTMHKTNDGRHYADFIKSWIDLDGNGTFETSETLLFGYHVVHSNPVVNDGPGTLVNQSFNFVSAPLTLTAAMVGDHYLLTRVTCSESLLATAGISGPWSNQWASTYTANNNEWYNQNFSPIAKYYQGEAEFRKLTVTNKVPEPGTLALLATALLGGVVASRRKQRHQPG